MTFVNGRWLELTIRLATPYQAMESTSSSCWYRSLRIAQSALPLRDVMRQFRTRQRSSCSDGDTNISRAERARQIADGDGEELLRTTCFVHNLASVRERIGMLRPQMVSHPKHRQYEALSQSCAEGSAR